MLGVVSKAACRVVRYDAEPLAQSSYMRSTHVDAVRVRTNVAVVAIGDVSTPQGTLEVNQVCAVPVRVISLCVQSAHTPHYAYTITMHT